jgi:hypothetical protein
MSGPQKRVQIILLGRRFVHLQESPGKSKKLHITLTTSIPGGMFSTGKRASVLLCRENHRHYYYPEPPEKEIRHDP